MKTALVLSGGGVKGSFQAGLISALYASGQLKDCFAVYGTSVGALNGSLLGFAPSQFEPIWKSIKKSDILAFNWMTLLGMSQGLYNMGPARKTLTKALTGSPWLEVHPCYTSLATGQAQYSSAKTLDRAAFIETVLASSSIPLAMEPIMGCVDGGTRQQTPLRKAIDDGAERIVIILCNPWVRDPAAWTIPTGFLSLVKIGLRGVDLLEHEVFRTDIETCLGLNDDPAKLNIQIELYAPDREWMDTLEFDSTKISNAFDAGKATAQKGPMPLT